MGTRRASAQRDDRRPAVARALPALGSHLEGKVHTLIYDDTCRHLQGICEWVACDDAVLTALVGGADGVAHRRAVDPRVPLAVTVPPALLAASGSSGEGGGIRLAASDCSRGARLLTAGAPATEPSRSC